MHAGGSKNLNERGITALLDAYRSGDEADFDDAFEAVYDELRRLARVQLRGGGNTLNTTGLVHELYLKLNDSKNFQVENRAHFLAVAARAMRQIIVDYARSKNAAKRGGDVARVPLDTNEIKVDDQAALILDVNSALDKIRNIDERLEKVFECRYFAGLTEEESAAALGVSVSTIQRDWRRAKAWMREALSDTGRST